MDTKTATMQLKLTKAPEDIKVVRDSSGKISRQARSNIIVGRIPDYHDLSEDSQKCLQFVIRNSRELHAKFENRDINEEQNLLVLKAKVALNKLDVVTKLKYVDFENKGQNMTVAMLTNEQYFPLIIVDKNNTLVFFIDRMFYRKNMFKIDVSVIDKNMSLSKRMTVYNEAF